MNIVQYLTRIPWSIGCAASLVAAGVAGLSAIPATADDHRGPSRPDSSKREMRMSAGTAFDLHNVAADGTLLPFPWHHQVRGVVQTSNLGNCTVNFDVDINPGSVCTGGHAFCLSGTLILTTLAGDTLLGNVQGWGDPDPKDPAHAGAMNLLHYDVTITGGTGALNGATGHGQIDGIFFFCGGNCFGPDYAGVATWKYDGVLHVPRSRH